MTRALLISLSAPDTAEGRGRMAHLITSACDLRDAGVQVEVYFAGIGVTWLAEFDQGDSPFARHYGEHFDAIRPLIAGACDFCASVRFKTAEAAARLGVPLLGDGRHNSVAGRLADGYQIINF